MLDDTVEVPPGHKVVVYRAWPTPTLRRAESGIWILNFGDGAEPDAALRAIERFVTQPVQARVIWILQDSFFSSVLDLPPFLFRIAAVVSASSGRISHCAVFPGDAASRRDLMDAFKSAGLGVHFGGPDGECFVEVHRPDGIVIGMPGQPYR